MKKYRKDGIAKLCLNNDDVEKDENNHNDDGLTDDDTIASLEAGISSTKRGKSSGPIDLDDDIISIKTPESALSGDPTVKASGSGLSLHKSKSVSSSQLSLKSCSGPLQVAVVRGRRLPKHIAAYAIAGDLSDEELEAYEEFVRSQELKEEQEIRVLCENLNCGLSCRGNPSESIPNRLRYFFLRKEPPVSSKPTLANRAAAYDSSNKMLYRGMRHLKSTAAMRKRPLSSSDTELLRCVGLDTFVMLRFLRFCFKCTFYPFLLSCLCLIPVYYTNSSYDSVAQTSGYFQFTINRLPPGSQKHWVPWAYSLMFHLFILRMIWVEWETFIALRFDFLTNGDLEMNITNSQTSTTITSSQSKDVQHQSCSSIITATSSSTVSQPLQLLRLQQEQFRNSCLVEFIPESHRRDKELFEYFDAVFPGQVQRAEILLNANTLTKYIHQRQYCIQQYEEKYAQHVQARAVYRKKLDRYHANQSSLFQKCCFPFPKEVQDPLIKMHKRKPFCCFKDKYVQVLPHDLSEINRLNTLIEQEHERITEEKMKLQEDTDTFGSKFANISRGFNYVARYINPIQMKKELTGDTGFVEFKSLTAKQYALQCNISGTTDFMLTISAPDPRDMLWDNATVSGRTIKVRNLQCTALLLAGVLFWGGVVVLVLSLSTLEWLGKYLPPWMIPPPHSFVYSLLQGYVPVVCLEVLMFFVQLFLKFIATNYIGFKTKSDIDSFVYTWHYFYRLANLLIIILSVSLKDALDDLWSSPMIFLEALTSGVSHSSQFFLNNAVIAAGTETFWELAQMPNMIKHFIIYKYITVEAKSQRALEKLQEPRSFEWGQVVPAFIFSFMAAVAYSAIVPLVTGACAVFFFIATKVYTHQALFVYSQRYESGGKLMYKINRTIFNYLYLSICFFSTVLLMKNAKIQSLSFGSVMLIVTFLMDRKIGLRFVQPSSTLALTNARIMDCENKNKTTTVSGRTTRLGDKESFYLYRQPQLHKALWETEPRAYR